MDSLELNSYISNMTKELKFCLCGSAKDTEEEQCKSSANSSFVQMLAGKFQPNPSIMGPVESFTCPTCHGKMSNMDKKIVGQIQQALLTSIQNTGINLDVIPPPPTLEELKTSDYDNFTISCDTKYLKRNAKGETPLHTAARKKDLEAVITMLRNNVNPNTQDNAGWTPLHEAVFDDNLEISLELLSAGSIVNVPGYDFTTPLHIATHHNNSQMVKLLLKFGGDPSARDISGRCPEFYAKHPDIVSSLKEYLSYPEMIMNAKRFQKTAAARPIVVYLTAEDALSFDEQHHLETELNIRFSKNLDKSVSHVIVDHTENNVCEPSFDVLKAILLGCVIVNKNWLLACDSANYLVNFSDYEVNGTTKFPVINGPRKARNNFLNLHPPLFTGFHIFLKKIQMGPLKDLIHASGAKLLNREPNPEHAPSNYYLYHCPPGHILENTATIILFETGNREPKLKYNMKHIKSLSVNWFFDCIQTFSIQEPEIGEETCSNLIP